jgi:hypothetical protein
MISPLSVLAPVPIADAMLISSSIPETDYAVYNSVTSYAVGARCISTVTHRIYESLVASNLNHDPTNIANRTGNTLYWADIAPTNKWAMFDSEVSTQSTYASPLTVVLRPGALNALFMAGIDAESLTISIKDTTGGAVIFTYTGTLEASMPPDYLEYFFDRFQPQTDFLASRIDMYQSMEVTITLTKISGTVKCGILALGDLRPLGLTQYGAKAKPKTYSYIKIDDQGNNIIKRRKSAKDMTATAWVDLSEANSVLDTITGLLDVPCLWSGTDLAEYTGLRVFGLGSAEMSYDYPKKALLTLTVQGLI